MTEGDGFSGSQDQIRVVRARNSVSSKFRAFTFPCVTEEDRREERSSFTEERMVELTKITVSFGHNYLFRLFLHETDTTRFMCGFLPCSSNINIKLCH